MIFFEATSASTWFVTPVAAGVRSLRSDDPLKKGHPRSIKQGLEPQRHSNFITKYNFIYSNI